MIQDGDRWMLVHHFYDRANNGMATLSIRPVLWGPDGWPVAADPGFVPAEELEPSAVTGSWHLSGYPEECSARAPDDVTVALVLPKTPAAKAAITSKLPPATTATAPWSLPAPGAGRERS